MNNLSKPSPPPASTPAPQKPESLKVTDSPEAILARIDKVDQEPPKKLTENEGHLLTDCEKLITKAQQTGHYAGKALATIRDARLYRESHKTFDEYLDKRWGFKRSRAAQLISHGKDQSEIQKQFTALMPEKSAEDVAKLIPVSEAHTRVLKGLSLEEKVRVWRMVVADKVAEDVTSEEVSKVKMEMFPTKKKERKAKVQESEAPIHLVASVTDGKLDIVTEPAKPQDGFKIELTVKSGSLKETRDALRRLAGKDLTKALKKAA